MPKLATPLTKASLNSIMSKHQVQLFTVCTVKVAVTVVSVAQLEGGSCVNG